MHGSMFVLIILSSNKMTVLVTTGHNEYYLVYVSIDNVHNSMHQAHHNTVALVGFLAMLKSLLSLVYFCHHSLIWNSWQGTFQQCGFPEIPPTTFPLIPFKNSSKYLARNDNSRGNMLLQWPLQTSSLWSWVIYCWLPGTGSACMHCARMVPSVCALHNSFSIVLTIVIC